MRSRIGRLVAALAIASAALCASGGVATAQVEPPALPPLPPLPPQLGPVLVVTSPITSPTCGSASLLALTASGLLPPTLGAGPLLGFLVSPAFVVCANVPVPDPSTTHVCAADDQVLAALSTVTLLVIGSGPPISTSLVGPIVDSLRLLEANAPGGLQSLGAAGLVSDALACRLARPTATTPPPAAVRGGSSAGDDANFDAGFVDGDFAFGPSLDGTTGTPAPRVPLGNLTPAPVVASAPRPFDYPLVFVLPLVLLAVGGYLARRLTEDVRLPT